MIYATPLLQAAPLPPLRTGIEILVAEARLLQQPTGLGDTEASLSTVLVSFDPTDVERRAARVLAASFIAAACSFEQAPAAVDFGAWSARTLQRLPASSICVVIALPDYSPEVESKLDSFLRVIRGARHHDIPLVVGVATNTADWGRCNLDGFVLSESGRCSNAAQVFAAVAAVMSPGLTCPLDAEDFRCALGTAANPSRIAEAVFHEDGSCFMPASCHDAMLLEEADGVAFMPSQPLRLPSQSRLAKGGRDSTKENAAITIIAPYGLTVDPVGSGRVVHVFLLCCASDVAQRPPTPSTSR